MNKKVAILGFGWVGKSMHKMFPDALIYDPNHPDNVNWETGEIKYPANQEDVNKCDVAFICVPTPNAHLNMINLTNNIKEENLASKPNESLMVNSFESVTTLENGEGKLDTSIVEEVIEWLETDLIVIRSTINPGDCDRWEEKYNKRIAFVPEYLGETTAHPLIDSTNREFLVVGANYQDTSRMVIELYQSVYNANINIRQVTTKEAEIIKLSENRAIAFKVAECQELYDVCELAEVDYYTIREVVYSDDPRFNLWWTFIFTDKRGMNSKCLPKDVFAWAAFAESLGYEPKITRGILEKNKEWIK